jgi:hypothetical protein
MYSNASEALWALVQGEEVGTKDVQWRLTRLTDEGTLKNGVNHCHVEITFANGLQFGITCYGDEASELHKNASILAGYTQGNVLPPVIA